MKITRRFLQNIVSKINNKNSNFRDFRLNLSGNGSTDDENEILRYSLLHLLLLISEPSKRESCAKLSKIRTKPCCKKTILSFLSRLKTRALTALLFCKNISVVSFSDYTLTKTFEARGAPVQKRYKCDCIRAGGARICFHEKPNWGI